MKNILISILILTTSTLFAQEFEEMAQTPPMGWNSWNQFGCRINENVIMEMSEAMVSSGMMDAGYEYIVIDDCWQTQRDDAGNKLPILKLDQQMNHRGYSGPGHWSDPDMMEVGNDGLSLTEARAHLGLWCMLNAPLIVGNDLRNMANEIMDLWSRKQMGTTKEKFMAEIESYDLILLRLSKK